MELSKRSLIIFGLGWLTSLVLAGCIAGYYYMEYQSLLGKLKEYEGHVMRVNICLDYGNGTIIWHNSTIVLSGCDLLSATKKVATVNCTYYEGVPGPGKCFVNAIDNVWNSENKYWMWYRWNTESGEWEYGHVGADAYILSPDETVMWRYEIPHYP